MSLHSVVRSGPKPLFVVGSYAVGWKALGVIAAVALAAIGLVVLAVVWMKRKVGGESPPVQPAVVQPRIVQPIPAQPSAVTPPPALTIVVTPPAPQPTPAPAAVVVHPSPPPAASTDTSVTNPGPFKMEACRVTCQSDVDILIPLLDSDDDQGITVWNQKTALTGFDPLELLSAIVMNAALWPHMRNLKSSGKLSELHTLVDLNTNQVTDIKKFKSWLGKRGIVNASMLDKPFADKDGAKFLDAFVDLLPRPPQPGPKPTPAPAAAVTSAVSPVAGSSPLVAQQASFPANGAAPISPPSSAAQTSNKDSKVVELPKETLLTDDKDGSQAKIDKLIPLLHKYSQIPSGILNSPKKVALGPKLLLLKFSLSPLHPLEFLQGIVKNRSLWDLMRQLQNSKEIIDPWKEKMTENLKEKKYEATNAAYFGRFENSVRQRTSVTDAQISVLKQHVTNKDGAKLLDAFIELLTPKNPK